MAFDQNTRGRLQKLVNSCRSLLSDEFSIQLRQIYGLDPSSGEVTPMARLTHLDDRERHTAEILRETLSHYLGAEADNLENRIAIIDRIVREQAFTVLNRLAALLMMEARGQLIESVSKGYQSRGYQLYSKICGTALGETGHAYQSYLYSLFDEFALELPALFSRFAANGLLFPRETALRALLDELNHFEVEPLWAEDETIGWIYQYFNSKEERKAMRDASQSPRNSRELAVRNQFFTPRYVVSFLVDNTLGRLWYEMTEGNTALKFRCRFLVRHSNEIFLEPGNIVSEQEGCNSFRTEQRLEHDAWIAHRELKDPRTIQMLDPACGSMHFGLYAFDIFEVIYDESWEIEEKFGGHSLTRPPDYKSLHETYPCKAAFLADVPRLIVENNLYGIDIDPRAVQIAGLSLWLRAQKSWQALDIKPDKRPAIQRSNVVCAEPMPGDLEFRKEFLETYFASTPEHMLVSQLVRRVFEAMKLVGELGSLLKIEEEIAGAVVEAKKVWITASRNEQFSLFKTDLDSETKIGDRLDTSGIADETFWEKAEESIYVALQSYAESVERRDFQRRLFAQDAARGFAFIDVCRRRYDVVLMNPPFGDCTEDARPLIYSDYGRERIDLGGCFITRFSKRLSPQGKLGVIANRTLLFAASLDEWRLDQLSGAETVVDLGHGVLDALVETAALTLGLTVKGSTFFVGALDESDKDVHIATCVQQAKEGMPGPGLFRKVSEFRGLFGAPFAYWAPSALIAKANQLRPAEELEAIARQGLATCDNFRFLRLAHEIPMDVERWVPLTKGGEYQPFWADVPLRVKWGQDGAEVKAYIDALHGQWSRVIQSTNLYRLPGATYSERTASSLSLRVLPRGSIFDKVGPFVGAENERRSISVALTLIGISYTTPYRFLVETAVGLRDGTTSGSAARHYLPSMVQRLPWPEVSASDEKLLIDSTMAAIEAARELATIREPNGCWHEPCYWGDFPSIKDYANAHHLRWCNILERIYGCAHLLEELSLRIFAIDSADKLALEAVAGRSVLSYKRDVVNDVAELQRLLDMPSEDLIADLVASGKAHATIYKKAYWGDRNLELISHLWEIHPISLLEALRECDASPKEIADSAWRIMSASVGFVFGHIRHEQFFQPSEDVLPKDVFTLNSQSNSADPTAQTDGLDICCDDVTHSLDLVRQVERVLSGYFQGQGPEQACKYLGERNSDPRRFFAQELFARHLSNYSDFRRQAPVYWPLSTPSGSYTLWIYYLKLNDQTLYRCVNDFVEPKLKQTGDELSVLREKGSFRTRVDEKQYEEIRQFELELIEFRDNLLELGKNYSPNHDDGVQITAAPLWKLFRHKGWQKLLKDTWTKLEKGEFDWAHLAKIYWPERVREKCKTDKSLAIAHGLEDLYIQPAATPKKTRKKKSGDSE